MIHYTDLDWRNAGIDSDDERVWRRSGFSPENAAEWVRAGVTDSADAKAWRSRSFRPDEAAVEIAAGRSLEQAIRDRYERWEAEERAEIEAERSALATITASRPVSRSSLPSRHWVDRSDGTRVRGHWRHR